MEKRVAYSKLRSYDCNKKSNLTVKLCINANKREVTRILMLQLWVQVRRLAIKGEGKIQGGKECKA